MTSRLSFDVAYGDRESYVPWFVEIERPDGSTFIMNATHTYRNNKMDPENLKLSDLRPEGYRQDFGPNRRSPSGAAS